MDELKLKIGTLFLKNKIATFISNIIRKKIGYQCNIDIHELDAKTEDGKIVFHADVSLQLTNDEFIKIIKERF